MTLRRCSPTSWPAVCVAAGSARAPTLDARGTGTFRGRVRDDRRHVDLDDDALAAIAAAGGKALVIDSVGDHTTAELCHDGERFVVRCEAAISSWAGRAVEVRPRGARS